MTATTTYDTQCKIIESLCMSRPQIVKTNPDRPNIYFCCKKRGNSGEEKLAPILDNLVAELDSLGLNTPFTLVYGTLEVVSECFLYVSSKLGKKQYYPPGSQCISANRLFDQYHAHVPEHKRHHIVDGLYQVTLS
jgi:hypothetical protein